MARRMKEKPEAHRKRIAEAAGALFEEKGIGMTTMNEIAQRAGYSKATLYVYFRDKEEIVGYLVLSSMKRLKEYLALALIGEKSYRERYMAICHAMVSYEEEYPFYFSLVLDYINIDFEHSHCEEAERETFLIGEEINSLLAEFFTCGMETGAFRSQLDVKVVIFSIWGMLSGLIQLAENKQAYISREMRLDKKEFLEKGFLLLYDAIEEKENTGNSRRPSYRRNVC